MLNNYYPNLLEQICILGWKCPPSEAPFLTNNWLDCNYTSLSFPNHLLCHQIYSSQSKSWRNVIVSSLLNPHHKSSDRALIGRSWCISVWPHHWARYQDTGSACYNLWLCQFLCLSLLIFQMTILYLQWHILQGPMVLLIRIALMPLSSPSPSLSLLLPILALKRHSYSSKLSFLIFQLLQQKQLCHDHLW